MWKCVNLPNSVLTALDCFLSLSFLFPVHRVINIWHYPCFCPLPIHYEQENKAFFFISQLNQKGNTILQVSYWLSLSQKREYHWSQKPVKSLEL